jgi:hypothetical protein
MQAPLKRTKVLLPGKGSLSAANKIGMKYDPKCCGRTGSIAETTTFEWKSYQVNTVLP